MRSLTPSVLNRSLAACVNRMLPDCMFVLTVSSGCEMNILHAPEEECEEKNISQWNSTTQSRTKDKIFYQQRRRPRNHNVMPFSLSFRQQALLLTLDGTILKMIFFFQMIFPISWLLNAHRPYLRFSWKHSTNNQIRLNTLSTSTVKTELFSNSQRDVNSDIKLSHSW